MMKSLFTLKALAIFSICIIFIMDLLVPFGTVIPILYLLPIFLVSNESKKTIITLFFVCIVLTLIEMFFGSYLIEDFFQINIPLSQSFIINRLLTIVGFILFTIILIKYIKVREEKNKAELINGLKLKNGIVKAQEDIQNRIGAELHDNVLQILAAAKIAVGLIKKPCNPFCDELLEQIKEQITIVIHEIRCLSHQLAPVFIGKTLHESITMLLNLINKENKFLISIDIDEIILNQHIPLETHLNLYRILQEQLNNIVKHASATKIDVKINLNQSKLTMLIVDNGIGFDVNKNKEGIGFANMQRRSNILKGVFDVESSQGKGSKVSVEIPMYLS